MLWLRALVAFLACCTVSKAGDWPQWLGPNRDGASSEVVVPWTQAPKVVWRNMIGEGNSAPVVADGRVFLLAKVKDKNEEEVLAFDADTGKPLWQQAYERASFQSLYGNGPRATPVVAGGHVYAFGITGVLTGFEAATGKKAWQVDTLKKFEAPNLFFGMSCSPIVENGRVLVNVGGKGASIVAFDGSNGEVVWKSLDDPASYSSPIAFGEAKERQVVFLTQQGLVSLNPANGHVFWKFPLVDKLLESSTTPVRSGGMLVGSSITYGSVGLRLEHKEGKPAASEAWKNEALTCYFATPIPVGEHHLYLVSGTKPPALFSQAKLHCLDIKTGKDLWSKPKIVGKYHATLLRTGDNKLLMLEEAGNLVLVQPNQKEYKELARSKVCGDTWAHPALANGRLYVRDAKELICLQMSAGSAGQE